MQRPNMFRLVLCSLAIIALIPASLWASDTPQGDRLGPVNPRAGLTIDDLSDGYMRGPMLASTSADWLLAQADDESPMNLDDGADVLGYKPKSPRRAFMQSLLIPGWGQWYTGNKWKPFVFLGLETLGWVSWSGYRSNGNDIQDKYEIYADEHWEYTRYESGLENVFDISIDTIPYIIIEDGVQKERVFSHHIYPNTDGSFTKDETYYENLGKYDQFVYGWDDFNDGVPIEEPADTVGVEWVPPHRADYLKQRDDSNREFSKASTVLILTMANHLLSAFEAAWSAQRYNRAIDQFGSIDTHLRLTKSEATGKLMANLAVRYNF